MEQAARMNQASIIIRKLSPEQINDAFCDENGISKSLTKMALTRDPTSAEGEIMMRVELINN